MSDKFNIVESNYTTEKEGEYGKHLNWGHDISSLKDFKILELKNKKNKILSLCLFTENQDYINSLVSENLSYCDPVNDKIEYDVLKTGLKNKLYLHSIYSFVKHKSYATKLLDYLKDNYGDFFTCSVDSSDPFFKKIGCKKLFTHLFIS